MNKRVLIIGVVGIAGIGAYLYFNSKMKKATTETVDNSESLISVPPKGEVLSSPEEVLETAKKIIDAKGLASKVYLLRIERAKLNSEPIRSGFLSTNEAVKLALQKIKNEKIKELDQKIIDIDKLINALGYQEANGNIVKIV